MKTAPLLLAALLALVADVSASVKDIAVTRVTSVLSVRDSHKISFRNSGDKLKQLPLLEITFVSVTPMEIKKIGKWKTEIDTLLKKSGKIEINDQGFHKLSAILGEYNLKFLSTSTPVIYLHFIRFGGMKVAIRKVHVAQ